MAQCDICNRPGMGTVVKADEMSNAVRKGFDPFEKGLADASMLLMAQCGLQSTGPEAWKQSAISGVLSKSDWNVCDKCMNELRLYLECSSSCFVATVCFGSFESPEVAALRMFRDRCLLPSMCGRAFVGLYYALSPSISDILRNQPTLAAIVRRVILRPIVHMLAKRG